MQSIMSTLVIPVIQLHYQVNNCIYAKQRHYILLFNSTSIASLPKKPKTEPQPTKISTILILEEKEQICCLFSSDTHFVASFNPICTVSKWQALIRILLQSMTSPVFQPTGLQWANQVIECNLSGKTAWRTLEKLTPSLHSHLSRL